MPHGIHHITATMNTEPPTGEAAEKARADAEARRQRILDKSNERMGIVAGANDDDEEAASRANKMQALRRRRFKQAAAAREAREGAGADTAEQTSVKPDEDTTKDEPPACAHETDQATVSDDAKDTDNLEQEGTQKKYKGVAKTRREMIKKKQQQQEEAAATTSVVSSKLPISAAKPPSSVNRIPIMFHLLTTFLLFIAGFDIGWNQIVDVDVTVHRELAPRHYGLAVLNGHAALGRSDTPLMVFEQITPNGRSDMTHEDEFSAENTDHGYVPVIDPLFGVDLNELTKGDDFLHTVARGAVAVHRFLIRLLYYLPLSIFIAILHIPKRLMATPPVLCLVSLALRQGSRLLVGAQSPDSSEGGSKSKDVLGMIKNAVISFLSSSFPTAVSLYDMFNHLRTDMYVILCGVFLGLALSHHGSPFTDPMIGEDETGPRKSLPQSSDEL